MGVPPVLIHFRLGVSLKSTSIFWGPPIFAAAATQPSGIANLDRRRIFRYTTKYHLCGNTHNCSYIYILLLLLLLLLVLLLFFIRIIIITIIIICNILNYYIYILYIYNIYIYIYYIHIIY